jgi:hypothetical protein
MINSNANQIERMRKIQKDSMTDTCKIGTYSETFDALGDTVHTWIDGDLISCGVNFTGGNKKYGDEVTVTNVVASIRLPLETVIASQDRITLTRTGKTYDVKNIKTGITCFVIEIENLKV